MSAQVKLVVCVAAIAIVLFAASYAGIFQYIAMPSAIQLLLQVVAVAMVVLGISCCAMYQLNKGIDQADRS
jgi:hypothetical protein